MKETQDRYSIRRIGQDDFDLLLPLMKNCFGMDVDIEYFRWKYTKNPAGSFIGFIAEDQEVDGQVGAYYGVIPQRFNFQGQERTIFQSCDTMTHSDHRRRGLFKTLALKCYSTLESEGKLFVIGFGGGQSTPGFLKFGWKHVFDFRYLFKPTLLLPRKQDIGFKEVDLDTFLQSPGIYRHKEIDGIYASRGEAHARWRLSNPLHEYRFIISEDDPSSYVVYYVQEDKVMLFDFHFGSKKKTKQAMRFLGTECHQRKLKGVVAFCQEGGADYKVLRESGFMLNPFKRGPLSLVVPFIFYSSDSEMERWNSQEHWQVRTYDHDAL